MMRLAQARWVEGLSKHRGSSEVPQREWFAGQKRCIRSRKAVSVSPLGTHSFVCGLRATLNWGFVRPQFDRAYGEVFGDTLTAFLERFGHSLCQTSASVAGA